MGNWPSEHNGNDKLKSTCSAVIKHTPVVLAVRVFNSLLFIHVILSRVDQVHSNDQLVGWHPTVTCVSMLTLNYFRLPKILTYQLKWFNMGIVNILCKYEYTMQHYTL